MPIKIIGLDKLESHFSEAITLNLAKQILSVNAAELNNNMVRNAIFVRGYSTGQTRRSIVTEMSNDGLTATVKPTTKYAAYLEWGTRKMSAQPFVVTAFRVQKAKFKSDMAKLVK